MSVELSTCISGSFKFKPEIDSLIEEFQDLGVKVLEPTPGWRHIPGLQIAPGLFRPLPLEVGLSAVQVEQRFLAAIRRSDFMYLHNREGYIGNMVAFEIGHAMGVPKPIFALEPITPENFEYELGPYLDVKSYVTVATPTEAVAQMREIVEL
jgi:hypothetical protein